MITFDSSAEVNTGVGTTITWSHTVGSFANRILMVNTVLGSGQTVTSMKYDNVSMTLLNSQAVGVATLVTYYLFAPTVGANNCEIIVSGLSGINASSHSFYNVSQSITPISGTTTNNATTSLTLTISATRTNSAMVTFARGVSAGPVTAGTGVTNTLNTSDAASGGYSLDLASGNNSHTWTTGIAQTISIVGGILSPATQNHKLLLGVGA